MSLTLDSATTRRFRVLTERLLSPLDYDDLSAWARTVLHATCALHHADRAELILPIDGSVTMWTEGIPPETVNIASEFVGELQPGRFRMKDPVMDRALRLRNVANMRVWSYASMERLAGADLPRCTFHQEFMAPAGIAHCYGIRVPLPLGDAHLAIGFSRPADDRLGVESVEELLGLVLPAFCAAVSAGRQIHHSRALLPHVIDRLGLAIALFEADGNEVHRTPELCWLLGGNPDSPLITAVMRNVVTGALALRGRGAHGRGNGAVSSNGCQEVKGTGTPYKVRAVFLPNTCSEAHAPMLLVEVRCQVPAMPTATELNALGLTDREAEVALLLAQGASNAGIAASLRISANTVRKHTEHIFDKLGIHTRKAFLLALNPARAGAATAGARPAVAAHRIHGASRVSARGPCSSGA